MKIIDGKIFTKKMMKYNFLLVSISLLVISCDTPSPEQIRKNQHLPSKDYKPNALTGKTDFHNLCARCHGKAARGTNQGPPLIHQYYRPDHHADLAFHWAVKKGVTQHHWHFGNMPPIPQASPEQVSNIIAYIRREQRINGIR